MCTELGANGLSVVAHSQHFLLYTLYDLLQGHSGTFWFAVINASFPLQTSADHNFQANNYWMLMEMVSLINKYGGITKIATEDKTVVTLPMIYDWLAKRDNVSGYGGNIGYSALCSTLELAGEDGQFFSFVQARLRYDVQAVAAQTNVTYSLAGAGTTVGGKTDANVCRVFIHRNTGYVTVESPYMQMVVGRIPGAGLTLSKLQVNVRDATHWYGVVLWVSEDGQPLGVGRSRLYNFTYPRDETQQFCMLTNARQQLVDMGYGAQLAADVIPGFEMRDGLELKLAMTAGQAVYQQVRGDYQQIHTTGDSFTGGFLYVQPTYPRLLVRPQ
jgi:hypothetical protein